MTDIELEQEIDQLLRDILYEDWMTEDDYKKTLDIIYSEQGVDKQELITDIKVGIENGYSAQEQIEMVKSIFNVPKQQSPYQKATGFGS